MIAGSDVEHLQQIYTGFARLHREGKLHLRQTIPTEAKKARGADRWVNYKFFNTTVIINGATRVCYDTHDWNWIDEEILASCNFYFKRSYDPTFISTLEHGSKVFPLGLNYQVASSEFDIFKLKRAAFYSGKDRIKATLKGLRIDNLLRQRETERIDNLEAGPDPDIEPRVLFMARAWNPEKIESKKQKLTVVAINEMRAKCIVTLRKELGDKFYGGLAHDEYSRKYFPDALLADGSSSSKRNYLELLKRFPICVATVGLNGSNGWKLAEYVAHSKAILSEPLVYQVPGKFEAGGNYIEFSSADDLATSAVKLIEDKTLRTEIMANNFTYYNSHVRPDAMIANSLNVVLEHTGSTDEIVVDR